MFDFDIEMNETYTMAAGGNASAPGARQLSHGTRTIEEQRRSAVQNLQDDSPEPKLSSSSGSRSPDRRLFAEPPTPEPSMPEMKGLNSRVQELRGQITPQSNSVGMKGVAQRHIERNASSQATMKARKGYEMPLPFWPASFELTEAEVMALCDAWLKENPGRYCRWQFKTLERDQPGESAEGWAQVLLGEGEYITPKMVQDYQDATGTTAAVELILIDGDEPAARSSNAELEAGMAIWRTKMPTQEQLDDVAGQMFPQQVFSQQMLPRQSGTPKRKREDL